MIQRWTMIVTYHPTPVVFLSPCFEGLLPELGFVRKLRTSKLPWFVALDFLGLYPILRPGTAQWPVSQLVPLKCSLQVQVPSPRRKAVCNFDISGASQASPRTTHLKVWGIKKNRTRIFMNIWGKRNWNLYEPLIFMALAIWIWNQTFLWYMQRFELEPLAHRGFAAHWSWKAIISIDSSILRLETFLCMVAFWDLKACACMVFAAF